MLADDMHGGGANQRVRVLRQGPQKLGAWFGRVLLQKHQRLHAVVCLERVGERHALQLRPPTLPERLLGLLDGGPAPTRQRLRLADGGPDAFRFPPVVVRAPALVGHAVETARGIAASHREVDHAVGPHFEVGYVERLAIDEVDGLISQLVGRAVAHHAHQHDASARPVGLEKSIKVVGGISVVMIELDADGRAASQVAHGRQAVEIVRRELARARSPAVITAGDDVHRPHVPVPGHIDVPLHIAVEREELTLPVVGMVEGVAEAAGQQRVLEAVEPQTRDGSARRHDADRVPPRVHVAVEELRFPVSPQGRQRVDQLVRNESVVAEHHRGMTVGATANIVWAVFADAPLEVVQLLEGVGPVVAVGVFEFVEAGLLVFGVVADGVERAAVKPHAVQHLDLVAEDLLGFVDSVAVVVEQDRRMPALARNDGAAEAVEGDLD